MEAYSAWQKEEVTNSYLEGARGAIPGSALQIAIIDKIIQEWNEKPVRILDLGCGDGVLGRCLLDTFPESNVTFADFSEPMLEALQKKLSQGKRSKVIRVDFATPGWKSKTELMSKFDVIVSGFASHWRLIFSKPHSNPKSWIILSMCICPA